MKESESQLAPQFFRVVARREEAKDTFTIELAHPDGRELHFAPGQFNMLYSFGVGEVPISISGPRDHRGSVAHTIKIVGNVTKALSRLSVGDVVGVRGPFGSAWPLEKAAGSDLLLLAGGIGLAPLRPLIYALLEKPHRFGNVTLLYGAREPDELLFSDEYRHWQKALNGGLYTTVDFAPSSWSGNVGVVTTLLNKVEGDLKKSAAFLCGPEVMLRFSISSLLQKNAAPRNIFLAMERNMKCAVAHCGRCQYLGNFLCREGSILPYEKVQPFIPIKEL